MSRTLEIRPEAEEDIDDAFQQYRDISTRLASAFIDDLDTVLSRVSSHPTIYQSVHGDLHRALLKRFPYAVFYTFTEYQVSVYGVFHQASDPARWER
jgi:plasmid stabilization system protein ParE